MKAKRRMQNVSFRNVGKLLDFLPEDELSIVERLREIVYETIPDVTERLSYQVPYYRRLADICFIWPGSVSWGSKTQNGVRFGFTQGYLLPDEISFLDKENRKQVYWHDFFTLRAIDEETLTSYLELAVDIDEQLWIDKQLQKR